jgi:hypothetical protein
MFYRSIQFFKIKKCIQLVFLNSDCDKMHGVFRIKLVYTSYLISRIYIISEFYSAGKYCVTADWSKLHLTQFLCLFKFTCVSNFILLHI